METALIQGDISQENLAKIESTKGDTAARSIKHATAHDKVDIAQ